MIALYDYENSLRKKMQYEHQSGISEGKKEGREEQARESAKSSYALGISVENIAKIINYPQSTVREWLGLPS